MPVNRTTIVQKHRVYINSAEVKDIIFVGGVGLGEEGSIEAVENDKKVDLSDGVRKIPPITLRIAKRKNLKTFEIFKDWWDNRANTFYDVAIAFLDKLYINELHRYVYSECELKSWLDGDSDQASPRVGTIDYIILPYDAKLITA